MGTKDDVKIGITFRREFPPEDVLAYARRVEALGFDEMWVVEDCFFASGIAAAASTLASTEKITVGVGIMPAVARNPVFTAMEIATLGRLYPGRFIAGIGHGVRRWMEQIGAMPSSQMAALREAVEIMQALLRGELVNYQGRQYTLDAGQLTYPPDAIPPIYLGVRGPKSLRLSGEIADGTILPEFSSPLYLARSREAIKAGNTSGKPHHITVFVYAYAADSIAEGREILRPVVAQAIASGRKDMYFDVFNEPELLRSLHEMQDLQAMAACIPDAWIDQMAIMGRQKDWEGQMDAFAQAGADSIVLVPLPEKGMAQVEVFAKRLFKGKQN